MHVRWTRREFLASSLMAPAAAANRGQTFPAERVRFADETTENEVFRLTGEDHNSFLPPPSVRSASSRNAFLIYCSDRTGSMQAYRMDIRPGTSQLLTEASRLDPRAITLTADQKSIVFFDANQLKMATTSGSRERTIAEVEGDRVGSVSTSEDNLHAAFFVRQARGGVELMLASLNRGGARTVTKVPPDASRALLRPKRDSILYTTGDSLWLVNFDGSENRKLRTPGPVLDAQWSPDGRTVLYLVPNEIREFTPDTNTDARVARNSQFVAFSRNADASVFVGASGSKASPLILILLRITARELALCEHRATRPAEANPVFSPSSQRIYFQSDRTGKSVIYSMVVDRLVEATET
jgi:oligogalacturonide lyase